MRKKLIPTIAGIAALAGPAVALAAQPDWGKSYSAGSGANPLIILVGSKASHSISSMQYAPYTRSPKTCSSNYEWLIKNVKISGSGRWSATRPSGKAKIHTTGVFTSANGGNATWQVVGCSTKHSFKFTRG